VFALLEVQFDVLIFLHQRIIPPILIDSIGLLDASMVCFSYQFAMAPLPLSPSKGATNTVNNDGNSENDEDIPGSDKKATVRKSEYPNGRRVVWAGGVELDGGGDYKRPYAHRQGWHGHVLTYWDFSRRIHYRIHFEKKSRCQKSFHVSTYSD
jgi:hypothetical protein